MLIKVIYKNGREGTVASIGLNYLIRKEEIIAFQRSDGWVHIGRNPTRNILNNSSNNPRLREEDAFLHHVL